jgi:hypothetical protein
MFSLTKIPYSPRAVINFAQKYNNIEMIEYLLKNELCTLNGPYKNNMIGYTGNEKLLDELTTEQLSSAFVGIFEGNHVNLFEKYKTHIFFHMDVYEIIKIAYKTNNIDILDEIIPGYVTNTNELSQSAIITGKCSMKNNNDVLLYIKALIDTNKIYSDYVFDDICDGLIEGEHYDIFMWFTNKENINHDGEYACSNEELMEKLIINNNFKFFTHIIMNNCEKWKFENYYCVVKDPYPYEADDHLDFCYLVDCCIDYRRIDMLLFLIGYITFNMEHYQRFLDKAKLLKFDDIANILISHSHLFKSYFDDRESNEKYLHNFS